MKLTVNEANDERVSEWLADWESAKKNGVTLSPEELCRDQPHLLPELRNAIDLLERTDWMVNLKGNVTPKDIPQSDSSLVDLDSHQLITRLSKYHILSETELEQLSRDASSRSAEDLTKELVDTGKLTVYQRKALLGVNHFPLVIDRYTIIDVIGAGGMGIVFQARHQQLDRLVAIKTLVPVASENTNRTERFLREIKSLSRLRHPNIVSAHDALTWHGQLYLVMELAEGKDLATLVKEQGPINDTAALAIIYQVVLAIEFAHQHGVIHRDIKPGNIMVGQDGVVKVLDLGLAKIKHEPDQLTHNSGLVGTPDFMAPELLDGSGSESEASDVYAIGCTLFFLLAGKPPFERDSPVKTLIAHCKDPIPQVPIDTSLRPMIQGFIDATLYKEAQSRVNIFNLKRALRASGINSKPLPVFSEQSSPAPRNLLNQERQPRIAGPENASQHRWWVTGAISLVVIACTVLGNYLFNNARGMGEDSLKDSLDRQVAKWVLSYESCSVEMETSIGLQTTSHLDALPEDEFQITGIQLYAPTDPPDFKILSKLEGLRWISLSDFEQEEINLADLFHCENLQSLYLENCDLEPATIEVVSGLENLEILDLSYSTFPQSPKTVYDFSKLKKLKELVLVETFLKNVQFPTSLKLLDLTYNELNDESIALINKVQNLEELLLVGNHIGDQGIENLKLPKLRHLDISSTNITRRTLKKLQDFKSLEALGIGYSGVDDSWIPDLLTLTNLRELDISDCDITDQGILQLSALTKLDTLTISNLQVSDETLDRLQASLPACDFLE